MKHSPDKYEKKRPRSIIDFLYVKLLRDPTANIIIFIISFVFIVWMVIPLVLVLSGGVYYGGNWSGNAIENVFTDPLFFNFVGDNTTKFFEKTESQIGGPSVSVEVYKNVAYIAERSYGIEILNVSDPNNIKEIGQYSDITSSILDIEIRDGTLYAAAGKTGLLILNISDPTAPLNVVSDLDLGVNNTQFVTLMDDLAIVGVEEEGFVVVNISNIYDPSLLANVTVYTDVGSIADVYSLDVWKDYAFVAGYSAGLIVFNLSNPMEPEQIAIYHEIPEIGKIRTQDIFIKDHYAFLTTSNRKGLLILDISNPLNVTYVSNIDTANMYDLFIRNNYAYVAVRDEINLIYETRIYDISNVSDPVFIGSFSPVFMAPEDIFVNEENSLIFLAMSGYGTYILDISDPQNPVELDDYVDTFTVTTYLFSGKNYGVVLNTIILGLVTTFFSVLFGTSLAFILARYEFPAKRLFSILALAPLIIPPFISGMGFRLLLGPNGFLNNLVLVPLFKIKFILQGFAAICFVQTFHFYALVYLNAFSSFVNIDPSMEEQAENLGANSFKLFRTVTLPLALPGIGAGAILTLILSMEDVGTPIIFAAMGDDMAKQYLTYYVFANFQRAGTPQITPEVCVLGGILLVIALVGFFAIRRYVSLRQYAMISKGRAGKFRITPAGWRLAIFYPYLIILFALSLLVHIGVFLMSIMETLGITDAHQIKFTFENYKLIFVSSKYNIPPYIKNTLVYSVSATILIMILGSLAAYVVSRKRFRGKNLFDALVTIPIAIPGIVLAIGMYRAFDWSGIHSKNPNAFTKFMADLTKYLRLDPFVTTAITLLIISYTIRKFPFTVRSAYAGLQQTDPVLEEASFNLGAGRVKTFSKITLPLISLNVFAGALVSFLYCLSEVSTTIFLIMDEKAGTITWLMAYHTVKFQIFCALGVILMLLQILSLIVTNVILGSRTEAITGI